MQPTMTLRGGQIIPKFYLKGNIEFKNVTFAYPARPQHVSIIKIFYAQILLIVYFRLFLRILI